MKVDDLIWHDGNLLDFSYTMNSKGKAELILIFNLYKDYDSGRTLKVKVKCKKIKSFDINLDMYELKDNIGPGHITNGYIKGNCLWVYFIDGFIKITSDKFVAQKC